jgi:hypothetical protein
MSWLKQVLSAAGRVIYWRWRVFQLRRRREELQQHRATDCQADGEVERGLDP